MENIVFTPKYKRYYRIRLAALYVAIFLILYGVGFAAMLLSGDKTYTIFLWTSMGLSLILPVPAIIMHVLVQHPKSIIFGENITVNRHLFPVLSCNYTCVVYREKISLKIGSVYAMLATIENRVQLESIIDALIDHGTITKTIKEKTDKRKEGILNIGIIFFGVAGTLLGSTQLIPLYVIAAGLVVIQFATLIYMLIRIIKGFKVDF